MCDLPRKVYNINFRPRKAEVHDYSACTIIQRLLVLMYWQLRSGILRVDTKSTRENMVCAASHQQNSVKE